MPAHLPMVTMMVLCARHVAIWCGECVAPAQFIQDLKLVLRLNVQRCRGSRWCVATRCGLRCMLPRFQNSLWGKVRITKGEREEKKEAEKQHQTTNSNIRAMCSDVCVCWRRETERYNRSNKHKFVFGICLDFSRFSSRRRYNVCVCKFMEINSQYKCWFLSDDQSFLFDRHIFHLRIRGTGKGKETRPTKH